MGDSVVVVVVLVVDALVANGERERRGGSLMRDGFQKPESRVYCCWKRRKFGRDTEGVKEVQMRDTWPAVFPSST